MRKETEEGKKKRQKRSKTEEKRNRRDEKLKKEKAKEKYYVGKKGGIWKGRNMTTYEGIWDKD